MDQPQRANAAQMAARNIKIAKSKHLRRPGLPQKDNTSGQKWPTPSGGDGLFGGNIQASGTFDFAAPSSLKFNPTPFQGASNNSTEEVKLGDGRFFGDDRNVKRLFGQSAAASEEKTASQLSNAFSTGQTVPNFNSGKVEGDGNPPFSFSGFKPSSFGQSTSTLTSTPASVFNFGAASQSSGNSNGIFSSTLASGAVGSVFDVSNQNKLQPTSSTPFQFGVPASQIPLATEKPVFGGTTAQSHSDTNIFGSKIATGLSNSSFEEQIVKPTETKSNVPASSIVSTNVSNIFGNLQSSLTQEPKLQNDFSHSESVPNTLATKHLKTWDGPNSVTSNPFSKSFSTNIVNENQKQSFPLESDSTGEKQKIIQPENNIFSQSVQSVTNKSDLNSFSTNLIPQFKKESSSLPTVFSPLKVMSGSNFQDSSVSKIESSNGITVQNSYESESNQVFNPFPSSGQSNTGTSNIDNNVFGLMKNISSNQGSFRQYTATVEPQSLSKIENSQTSSQDLNNTHGSSGLDVKQNKTDSKTFETGMFSKPVEPAIFQPKVNTDYSNIFAQSLSANPTNITETKLSNNLFGQVSHTLSDSNYLTGSLLPFSQSNLSIKKKDNYTSSPTIHPTNSNDKSKSNLSENILSETRKRNKFAPNVMPKNPTFRNLALVSQIKDDDIVPLLPPNCNEDDRQQFFALYRLRALNQAMGKMFLELPTTSDPQVVLNFFMRERQIILENCSNINGKIKRKFETEDCVDQIYKKRKQIEMTDSTELSEKPQSNTIKLERKRKFDEDEYQEPPNTDKRSKISQSEVSENNSDDSQNYPNTVNENVIMSTSNCKTLPNELSISSPQSKNSQTNTSVAPKPFVFSENSKLDDHIEQERNEISLLKHEKQSINSNSLFALNNSKDSNTANKFKSILDGVSSTKSSSTTESNTNSGLESKNLSLDQTWKPDTPIRFAPATNPLSQVFDLKSSNSTGSEIVCQGDNNPVSSTNSTLFSNNPFAKIESSLGSKTISSLETDGKHAPLWSETTSKALFSNVFNNLDTSKPKSSSGKFSFGQPVGESSLFTTKAPSTSQLITSGDEPTENDINTKTDKENEVEADKNEQIDLTVAGPGEENEESIHEVRAKALQFVNKEGSSNKQWEVRGLGPLRILKHRDSGVCRMLLRGDPSGKVILNKALLGNVDYESSGKTLKFLSASDSGNGVETWLLQVKTEESAKELASILEKQKPKS